MYSRQYRAVLQKLFSIAALAVTLTACGGDEPVPEGAVGHVKKYFGGVTADEPHAALIGRDVLSAGGTAGDAVAAMAFALMVTRPDSAGAGGGGICLGYDPETNKAEALEFLPHPARARPPAGRWVGTAPGSFRGLFVFHARYGKLRWEQIVFPAERLARFGVDTSKSFVLALQQSSAHLQHRPSTASRFFPNGKMLAIRDRLVQPDLAGTLGRIRIVGPGDFYEGKLSNDFVGAVGALGGWLSKDDLRDYRPRWLTPEKLEFGNHAIFFAPSPALGGQVAGQLWRALGNRSSFLKAKESRRLAALANAAHRAYAMPNLGSSTSRSSAGVAAMDRSGRAAACVLTMNRSFGVGRLAGETGMIPAPPADLDSTLGLVPVVMANTHTEQGYLVATGAGDRFAPLSLVSVLLRLQNSSQPKLADAIASPRVAPLTGQQSLFENAGADAVAAIRSTGRQIVAAGPMGISSVNVLICTDGVRDEPNSCRIAADQRRGAYAVNAEKY